MTDNELLEHIKTQLEEANRRSLIYAHYVEDRFPNSIRFVIFLLASPNVNQQLTQLNALFTTKYGCTTTVYQDQLAFCALFTP